MPLSQPEIDVLNANITVLNSAIASGERQVSIGGQSITYQTVAALIQARNDQRTELARGLAVAAPRPKQTYVSHGGRGYE